MKQLVFVILSMVCGQSSFAQSSYEEFGSIDGINLEEGYIVMRDKAYSITTKTKFYSPESQVLSPTDLEAGWRIGFRVLPGSNQLMEVWTLD